MSNPSAAPGAGPSNRRVQILAAAIFAALVIVVIVVLVGGRPAPGGGDSKAGTAGVAQTKKLLEGLKQTDTTLGDPKAPVTVVEFVDLQCPFCAAHQLDEQPKVVNALVRTGKARITVEPLAFLGPQSGVGRNVFLRLAAKGHGWDYLNRAFYNQRAENSGYMTDTWLKGVTAGIPGVTAADLARPREAALEPRVAQAEALSKKLMKAGDGTPFFAVGLTSADPATYKKIDLGAKHSPADSIIAAAAAAAKTAS